MNRRCLSVSIQRRGGADPPPTWEQLRGAGFQAHYYYNSTNGWFPRLSNTTYETELGDGRILVNSVKKNLETRFPLTGIMTRAWTMKMLSRKDLVRLS